MDQAFNILRNAVRFAGIIFIVVNLSVKVVVVLVILVPVSYTHLDVYKRQVVIST